ncbi:hypothetical protein Tco_0292147 [Tanacetum coccineum]
MSIEEMMHEQQLVDREIKEIINDLGYKRFRGEEINEEYERDCEIRIRKLKQDFNIWGRKFKKEETITTDLPIEEPDTHLNNGRLTRLYIFLGNGMDERLTLFSEEFAGELAHIVNSIGIVKPVLIQI